MANQSLVSSPDIEGMNILLDRYKAIDGNGNATMDELFSFLAYESPERKIFLDANCNYSFLKSNRTIILKVEPK